MRFYTLHIVYVLLILFPGPVFFPTLLYLLLYAIHFRSITTTPASDPDSDNEETPIYSSEAKPAPVGAILSVSGSRQLDKDDDTISIGSFTSQRASLATFVNEAEYNTVAEHLSVLFSSLWTSIREST